MMQTAKKGRIHDVLGVGLGPFNLSGWQYNYR